MASRFASSLETAMASQSRSDIGRPSISFSGHQTSSPGLISAMAQSRWSTLDFIATGMTLYASPSSACSQSAPARSEAQPEMPT